MPSAEPVRWERISSSSASSYSPESYCAEGGQGKSILRTQVVIRSRLFGVLGRWWTGSQSLGCTSFRSINVGTARSPRSRRPLSPMILRPRLSWDIAAIIGTATKESMGSHKGEGSSQHN